MKISNYNVTLTSLTEDKIEMVRNWRNDPKIAKYMVNKEFITPEMQIKWFSSINNENSYYFIIEYERKEIGLILVRNINSQEKEGEGGIYIYDDDYLNSDVSFRAVLCLQDFCFDTLKFNQMIAHIFSDNIRAIRYNKFLGYKLVKNQVDVYNQKYTLSAEDHYKNKEKIIQLLSKT